MAEEQQTKETKEEKQIVEDKPGKVSKPEDQSTGKVSKTEDRGKIEATAEAHGTLSEEAAEGKAKEPEKVSEEMIKKEVKKEGEGISDEEKEKIIEKAEKKDKEEFLLIFHSQFQYDHFHHQQLPSLKM